MKSSFDDQLVLRAALLRLARDKEFDMDSAAEVIAYGAGLKKGSPIRICAEADYVLMDEETGKRSVPFKRKAVSGEHGEDVCNLKLWKLAEGTLCFRLKGEEVAIYLGYDPDSRSFRYLGVAENRVLLSLNLLLFRVRLERAYVKVVHGDKLYYDGTPLFFTLSATS